MYSCVGSVYKTLGKFDVVLEYLRKSLEMQILFYSYEHIGTANIYNNIGLIY